MGLSQSVSGPPGYTTFRTFMLFLIVFFISVTTNGVGAKTSLENSASQHIEEDPIIGDYGIDDLSFKIAIESNFNIYKKTKNIPEAEKEIKDKTLSAELASFDRHNFVKKSSFVTRMESHLHEIDEETKAKIIFDKNAARHEESLVERMRTLPERKTNTKHKEDDRKHNLHILSSILSQGAASNQDEKEKEDMKRQQDEEAIISVRPQRINLGLESEFSDGHITQKPKKTHLQNKKSIATAHCARRLFTDEAYELSPLTVEDGQDVVTALWRAVEAATTCSTSILSTENEESFQDEHLEAPNEPGNASFSGNISRVQMRKLFSKLEDLHLLEAVLLASPPDYIDVVNETFITSVEFVRKYSSQRDFLHLWRPHYVTLTVVDIALRVAMTVNEKRRERWHQLLSQVAHYIHEEESSLRHFLGSSVTSEDYEMPSRGSFASVARRTMSIMSVNCSLPDACSGHGTCNSGICICVNDATGHWSGTYCAQCDTGWAGETCLTECNGGYCDSCSGHGTCSYGVSGDGSCTCNSDSYYGYWTGTNCDTCVAGFFGESCTETCPGVTVEDGQPCHGRGQCSSVDNGICICNTGYGSESYCAECDAAYYGMGCTSICRGAVNVTDSSSSSNHSTKLVPCSNHGTCFSGTNGNGTCVCDKFYAGPLCNLMCPNLCSDHGTCNDGADGNAKCTCDINYAPPTCQNCYPNVTGSDCSIRCPEGANGRPCSGNGECSSDGNGGSQCTCAAGYVSRPLDSGNSPVCQFACPSATSSSPPCSGHGICLSVRDSYTGVSTEVCQCYSDSINGHWAGEMCERCDAVYNQSVGCRARCPTHQGVVCNNHGTCSEGRCYCYTNEVFKYCGDACETRADFGSSCSYSCAQNGYYGANCNQQCPGSVTACSGHGWCSDGRFGTGVCSCEHGYTGDGCELACPSNTFGICGGPSRGTCVALDGTTATCQCLSYYGGSSCEAECPIRNGLVCSGKGTCQADGTCLCNSREWTGEACDVYCLCNIEHGMCDATACKNNLPHIFCSTCSCDTNFTGDCSICAPGHQGENCEGECRHGVTEKKSCICEDNYATASCTVACPRNDAGVICSDNGYCNQKSTGDGTCKCFPLDAPLYFGPVCATYCSEAFCENLGFEHSFCNAQTGACECLDNDDGHWADDPNNMEGQRCTTCKAGYWGPSCAEPCSCNDHGVCDPTSGDCSCYASPELGYFSGAVCDKCALGYIGENCDRENVEITRISAERTIVNGDLYSPSNIPLLQNTALAVDEDTSLLYVGSPNVIIDVSDINYYTMMYSTAKSPIFNRSFAGNSSSSSAKVFQVFVDTTHVYYLLQPLTSTSRPRLLKAVKGVYTDSSLVDLFADLNAPVNLDGFQIIASDFLDRNLVAVAAMVNNSRITQSVLLWRLLDAAGVYYRELPPTFVCTDIAVANYISSVVSGREAAAFLTGYVLSESGGEQERTWELLSFKVQGTTVNTAFPLISSTTVDGSIRNAIPCWPSEISSPSTPTIPSSASAPGKNELCVSASCQCPSCTALTKIKIISGSAMLVSVSTSPTDLTNAFVVYLELIQRAPITGEKGPNGETADLWFLTNLDTTTCTPHKRTGLEQYEDTQGAITNSFKCNEVSCFDKARFFVKVAQTNLDNMQVSAMITDPYASVGYVALFDPKTAVTSTTVTASSSSLLKLSISPYDFGVYGSRYLNRVQLDANDVTHNASWSVGMKASEQPTALILDNSSRLLYCVFSGISRFRIGVFLAYEVTEIDPSIAGLSSNTTINVWGNGFAQLRTPSRYQSLTSTTAPLTTTLGAPTSTPTPTRSYTRKPYCLFGGEFIEAVYVNRTLLLCRVPEMNETTVSDQCVGSAAEVTLFEPDRMVTNNELTLRRAPVVVLDSCTPTQGYFKNKTRVRIYGSGFVDKPTCKFYSSDSSNPEVSYSAGTIDDSDPNVIFCDQSAMQNASRGNGLLAVSLDKQQYSEPLQYEVVGDASEIRISSSSTSPSSATTPGTSSTVTIKSDVVSYFQISAYVVDIEGHELAELDSPKMYYLFTNISREVECDPNDPDYTWRTADDGFPYPRCADLLLNNITSTNIVNSSLGVYENNSLPLEGIVTLTNTSSNGTIVFGSLFLYRPVITSLLVQMRGAPPFENLFARARIEITEGDPVALAISNRQTFVDNPLLIPRDSPIKPDIVVIIVDVNGNVITNEDTISKYTVTAIALKVDDETGVETEDQYAVIPTPSSALTYSKVQLSYIHGMNHYVQFTSVPVLRRARTPPIRTARCATTSYKRIRTGDCLPCPSAGAICSGTELIYVQAGYWRGRNSSDAIYPCDAGPSVCLGNYVSGNGSFCANGYLVDSPVCSVCQSGWAKSGADTCLECMRTDYAVAIIAVAGVAVLIGVVVWVIMTLRRADTTDLSVVSRTLMNHFQATGELGEFSVRFDPFLRNVFSIQSSASSFSLNGLQIAGCLLQAADTNYSSVFWGYMATPIICVFLAFAIFIVVRIFGMVPVITDKLRGQIMEDLRSIGEQAPIAILLRKYPIYMVVTTTLCVTMFTLYQTLIAQATKVLRCVPYEVGKDANGKAIVQQYLEMDMSIKCDSQGQHDFYIPALVFAIGYGVGIPAVFIFGYQTVNGRVDKPELTKLIFLFLTGGYKEEFYFWQALIMVRKLVIVLIVVLIPDAELQTYVGMLVMASALGLQLLLNPAEKVEHNVVEAISLSIITATLSLSMVYFWPVDAAVGDAVTVIILIVTFGAILVFVVFCIDPVKDLIIDTLKTAREIVDELKADLLDNNEDKDDNNLDDDVIALTGNDERLFQAGEGYDELEDLVTGANRRRAAAAAFANSGAVGGIGGVAATNGKQSAGHSSNRHPTKRGVFSAKSSHGLTLGTADDQGVSGGLLPDYQFELLDDAYSSPIELPEYDDEDEKEAGAAIHNDTHYTTISPHHQSQHRHKSDVVHHSSVGAKAAHPSSDEGYEEINVVVDGTNSLGNINSISYPQLPRGNQGIIAEEEMASISSPAEHTTSNRTALANRNQKRRVGMYSPYEMQRGDFSDI